MRVILLSSASSEFGGIERQILHIAAGFHASGRIAPALVTDDVSTTFAHAFSSLGLPVIECEALRGPLVTAVWAVLSLIRRYDVDVIQSHLFRMQVLGSAAQMVHRRVRHVARIHTYIDCSWIPEKRRRAYHRIARVTSPGTSWYVPISDDVRTELIGKTRIAADRITVVPNGVPPLGDPDPPATPGNKLTPRIAMVSNFVERKGHDVLIRALSELKRRGLTLSVRLIGGEQTSTGGIEGSIVSKVRDLASRAGVLDQLEFYGFTTDVFTALRSIPVIVLPSDREGLPNCLLEAMSVRKLVVASRVGGIPEIVTDGWNGMLHGAQDHSGLADLLEKIFQRPGAAWEAMRNRGLDTWRTRFSVGSMVERLMPITLGEAN